MIKKIEKVMQEMLDGFKQAALDSQAIATQANERTETYNIKGQAVAEVWQKIRPVLEVEFTESMAKAEERWNTEAGMAVMDAQVAKDVTPAKKKAKPKKKVAAKKKPKKK